MTVALLAASATIELLVCATVRYALAVVAAWAVTGALALPSALDAPVALVAAWLPIAAAAAALAGILPGGGWWMRRRLGARLPSRRERAQVDVALAALERPFDRQRIAVVDDSEPGAFTLGATIYLHRRLIADEALAAALAHEIGHLRGGDGRVALALWSLAPLAGRRTRTALAGGLSLVVLRPLWELWLRRREHAADRYAAGCGRALDLVRLLESRQALDVAAPYLRGRTHPYVEERIDRLLATS